MKNLFINSIKREVRRFGQNRLLLTCAIIMPVLMSVMSVFMFQRGTLHELSVSVYDGDRTELSRQLIRMINATPTAHVVTHVESIEQGHQTILKGSSAALIVIPKGLQEIVYAGNGQAQITAHISGVRILNSGVLQSTITTIFEAFNIGIETELLGSKGIPATEGYTMARPVIFEKHILFNPYGSYAYYLLPALLPLMLIITASLVTVYVIGSELRYGTAGEWVETAGGSITRAVTTKLMPYVVLFCLLSLFTNTLLYRFMGLPFHGNEAIILVLGNLFVILAYMAIGVILVALSANMRFSLSMAGGLATASLSLCGLTFPSIGMYPVMAALSKILPFTYYVDLFIEQSMRGAPPARSLGDLAAMGCFILLAACFVPRLGRVALDSKYYNRY